MNTSAQTLESHIQRELGTWVVGMDDVIHALTIAFISRGHVLLEGPPGLGKTRLSKAFARVIGGEFKRVQGTADLMPSDVTGVQFFNAKTQTFEFVPGPIFTDVLLVDEINRTGPKTQSSLLEAMEEGQVTVDRERFALAEDFMVIATRNSLEFEGTFPMPESQMDRFALCIPVGYLDRNDESLILKRHGLPPSPGDQGEQLQAVPAQLLAQTRESLEHIHVADELHDYILDVAAATRSSAYLSLGLSMRGALALARASRVEAALRGGDFVIPDDVKRVAPWVVPHRLRLTAEAMIDGKSTASVMDAILDNVTIQG